MGVEVCPDDVLSDKGIKFLKSHLVIGGLLDQKNSPKRPRQTEKSPQSLKLKKEMILFDQVNNGCPHSKSTKALSHLDDLAGVFQFLFWQKQGHYNRHN